MEWIFEITSVFCVKWRTSCCIKYRIRFDNYDEFSAYHCCPPLQMWYSLPKLKMECEAEGLKSQKWVEAKALAIFCICNHDVTGVTLHHLLAFWLTKSSDYRVCYLWQWEECDYTLTEMGNSLNIWLGRLHFQWTLNKTSSWSIQSFIPINGIFKNSHAYHDYCLRIVQGTVGRRHFCHQKLAKFSLQS